jgi:hypothetical protein
MGSRLCVRRAKTPWHLRRSKKKARLPLTNATSIKLAHTRTLPESSVVMCIALPTLIARNGGHRIGESDAPPLWLPKVSVGLGASLSKGRIAAFGYRDGWKEFGCYCP